MKVFKEKQRFTQLWLIILSAVSVLIPLIILINDYTKTDSQVTLERMIFIMSLMLLFVIPIFFITLKTKIDETGIQYQFFPFHLNYKTISWSEIKTATIRTYNPISEYGGWGLKGWWFANKGTAINVSGNIGIQLELRNGKKLLIGTNKKEEAARVLATYINKENAND